MHVTTGSVEFELWRCALWGALGGLIVDALEFYRVVRNNGGRWPEDMRSLAFLVAELIRLGVGAILAVAFASSGHVSDTLGALAVGAAAPLIAEKLARQIPSVTGGVE